MELQNRQLGGFFPCCCRQRNLGRLNRQQGLRFWFPRRIAQSFSITFPNAYANPYTYAFADFYSDTHFHFANSRVPVNCSTSNACGLYSSFCHHSQEETCKKNPQLNSNPFFFCASEKEGSQTE
jgi:hypothetical protein